MKRLIKTLLAAFIIPLAAAAVVAQHEGHGNMGGTTDPVEKVKNYYYSCSMHPEVVSDSPGFCYKCNMGLVTKEVIHKSAANSNKKYFYCPDHPGHKYQVKGKCSECRKKLKRKKTFTYE